MKNFKKVLALVLVVATLLSFATVASAINTSEMYADADKIANIEAVDVLTAAGILNGKEGSYDPAGTLKRSEAAKIIACFDNKADVAESYAAANTFADVASDAWYVKYVAYCAKKGIISGVGNNKFAPDSKVTGIQFLKMILGVLGYNQTEEGFTGNSWKVNVLKAAKDAGLLDVLGTKYDYDAELTRDAAAQIMLNALEAETVVYGQQFKGRKNVVLTVAGAVGTGDFLYEDWDLKKTQTYDAFERPSTKWDIKDGKKWVEIGTYADAPVYTYNAEFAGCDAIADAGIEKETRYAMYVNGWKDEDGFYAYDKSGDKHGAQGRIVEFYEDDNERHSPNGYLVVVIDTYLATVTKVTNEKKDSRGHIQTKAAVTLEVYAEAIVKNQNMEEVTGFAKNDKVLVTYSEKTRAFESIEAADSQIMALTSYKNNALKLDGSYIEKAYTLYYDLYNNEIDDMIGCDVVVYFDTFGNVIGIEKYFAELSFAVIEALWIEGTRDPEMHADIVTIEGDEIEDVIIAKLDGKDAEKVGDAYGYGQTNLFRTKPELKAKFYNKLMKYTVNDDGEYTFTFVTKDDEGYANRYNLTDDVDFTAGKRIAKKYGVSVFTMTADTLVLVYNAKKDVYTAYTGYADLPKMTGATVEWFATEENGKTAELVFIVIGNTALEGESKILYFAGAEYEIEYDEGEGADALFDYTFNAWTFNEEDGTFTEEEFTINATKAFKDYVNGYHYIYAYVDENNELQYNVLSNDIYYGQYFRAVEITDTKELNLWHCSNCWENDDADLYGKIEGDFSNIYVLNTDDHTLDEYAFEDIEGDFDGATWTTQDFADYYYNEDGESITLIVLKADNAADVLN